MSLPLSRSHVQMGALAEIYQYARNVHLTQPWSLPTIQKAMWAVIDCVIPKHTEVHSLLAFWKWQALTCKRVGLAQHICLQPYPRLDNLLPRHNSKWDPINHLLSSPPTPDRTQTQAQNDCWPQCDTPFYIQRLRRLFIRLFWNKIKAIKWSQAKPPLPGFVVICVLRWPLLQTLSGPGKMVAHREKAESELVRLNMRSLLCLIPAAQTLQHATATPSWVCLLTAQNYRIRKLQDRDLLKPEEILSTK